MADLALATVNELKVCLLCFDFASQRQYKDSLPRFQKVFTFFDLFLKKDRAQSSQALVIRARGSAPASLKL